ncbi:MAG: prepilin-type N-terminal cleavage/methylation domain-containing protein [Candidatus Sumerlaeia bacterium]|nr:prepilin-type N-terminal cleavage/methylation domain-containing protein [Candidatus Sumerlaeia bacterium]
MQFTKPITTIARRAFTLIELLIVVAIIAILAAIAVPNFLEAQTRAKVSRVKADMRTAGTAIEMYYVDNNSYPTGWGTHIGPNPDAHSLFLLSTPIAYITSGNLQDPFNPIKDPRPMYSTVQYDPMTVDGRMFSEYHFDIGYIQRGEPAPWWVLISAGPDMNYEFTYNPTDGQGVEWRTANANANPGAFSEMIYDPTNGTVSRGNVWRAGGSQINRAGMMIIANH